jgi:hypothetical protein
MLAEAREIRSASGSDEELDGFELACRCLMSVVYYYDVFVAAWNRVSAR